MKRMRKLLLPIVFVLLFSFVQAANYSITLHSIDIRVDNEGYGTIDEKFYLSFPTSWHLEDFREQSESLGVNLKAWESFDISFRTYIGEEKDAKGVTISFVENDSKYLQISYGLQHPVMEKIAETSRTIDFELRDVIFSQFDVGGLYAIPEGTVIAVIIPTGAELLLPVKPEASILDNIVVWEGYKSDNTLNLRYTFYKQIAPSFDISEILNELTRSEFFWVFVIVVLLVIGIVYWKRSIIAGKIENYIVEHSELGPKEISEEEELE